MLARLHVLMAKLAALLRGDARDDAALADEVAHHLALLEERYRARGMSPDEARREARRAFGGVPQLAEANREVRSFVWIAQARQDAGYALRMLRRSPGFTLAALVTLALGIGANTAVFSVVNAVILRPLPYPDADRLQRVGWDWNGRGQVTGALAPYKFAYLRQHAAVFSALATWQPSTPDLGVRGSAGPVNALRVSDDFFTVTGWQPALGRAFTAEEHAPGGPVAAVLTAACWRARFGADPGVIGRTVLLDDRPFTVVGVMPSSFEFPEVIERPAVIVPLQLQPSHGDLGANYPVLGRLRGDVTADAAARDMDRVFGRLRAEQPAQFSLPDERGALMTFGELYLSEVERPLWIMLAGVTIVLLIACTNVANLLLARATARVREMAVRAAIGASRGRLLRQGLAEGLVLATLGGAIGIAAGAFGVGAIARLAPSGISRIDQVGIDATVLAAAALVVLATGMLFGLASSRYGGRRNLSSSASTAGRGTAATRAGQRIRQLLIAGQATLATVLLGGAVLLVSSFYRLTQVDLGFEARGVMVMSFRRLPASYRESRRIFELERQLRERLAALPGVTASATSTVAPLGERGWNMPMTVDGRPDATEGAVEWRAVSREYARLMGLRLLAGRWLAEDDYLVDRAVVVVNASFARRYWPDGNAIGQRIWLGVFRGERRPGAGEVPREVVGVVNDFRELGPTRTPRRTAYLPYARSFGLPFFLIRAPSRVSTDVLRAAVHQLDPALPEPTIATLDERLGARLARDRFASLLMTLFAGVALTLTIVGIYGVVAWVVRQSTREIGIRMALGADGRRVLRGVMARGLAPVSAGLLAGGAGSIMAARLFAGLASVPPTPGAWVPAAASALLFFSAAIATWIPARRALAVDPASALRAE